MFTVYSESDMGSTLISNIFIDKYMKDANDAQLKVYLYLLRMMNAGRSTSIPDMADQFNHTEREVIRSLRYWENRGLIELEYSSAGDLMSLHMVPLRADGGEEVYPVPFNSMRGKTAPSGEAPEAQRAGNDAPAPALPRLQSMEIPAQHSAAEPDKSAAADRKAGPVHPDAASVEAFRSSAKRAQLLFVIEQYIGKPLAPNEVESVYYISEQLHFSDALIDYLLQYCIDRGKKDFRYIQKVAVNWAEHGITTPKQAERAASGINRNRKGYQGVRSSANPFNQFEQNQYDFDQLEKDILSN